MPFDGVKKNLEARGNICRCFSSSGEAAAYLDSAVDGLSVGVGGSMTVKELGLYDLLSKHNRVYWHWRLESGRTMDETRALTGSAMGCPYSGGRSRDVNMKSF